MARRMLIDASAPGEVRMALVDGNQLIDYDFEAADRRQVKSSIFLAQVTRVEPSLQAAFLEYGSMRQGFLALPEIHPDYYKIPVADRDQLNAALKASAAEVQAEIDDMVEDESASSAIDRESTVDNAAAPDDVPMLSTFGRGELIAALSEFLSPAPDMAIEPVQNNFSLPEDQGAAMDGDDLSAQGRQGNGQWRGRTRGRWHHRREQLDPEAMEAARRRQLLRSYKIQEVIKRRQVMLVQVNKEERGTKGAALTTYISLPGRYCVLMPNSPNAGGVSRKITNPADRRRMKEVLSQLNLPEGMGIILRTAGMECAVEEIKRDLNYLLRLWDSIREHTLKSTAPALIYEEGDLITRALRDLYSDDIDEVQVSGETGYQAARNFMEMLLPHHVNRIKYYEGRQPLFARYRVDEQIDAVHEPSVQLPSGGYIVINQTEALVAIDVNSGRSTRERNIEETAYRTNLEAAVEVARQLRLRDLAGLVVVDFIDMEDYRHRIGVERRMRDAMKADRARVQVGRISTFGLLELSRQRLRPSVMDAHFTKCEACAGSGWVRSLTSSARYVLRALEQELSKGNMQRVTITVHSKLALQLLNHNRGQIQELEERFKTTLQFETDDKLVPPDYRLERARAPQAQPQSSMRDESRLTYQQDSQDAESDEAPEFVPFSSPSGAEETESQDGMPRDNARGGRRRFRGRDRERGRGDAETYQQPMNPLPATPDGEAPGFDAASGEGRGGRNRRGGRGGRGRGRFGNDRAPNAEIANAEQPSVAPDAFASTKPYWQNNNQTAASAPHVDQPQNNPQNTNVATTATGTAPTPAPMAVPPPAVTTAPVVTKITSEGEAMANESAEGSSGRKGWWNKLMKA